MTVELRLDAGPATLTADTRDQFELTLTAANTGAETVNPELHRTELQVNGRRSRAFSSAVSNGRREERWFALPPGESVSMTWSTLGKSLFPEPGEFTLVLSHDGREAEPVVVSVAP